MTRDLHTDIAIIGGGPVGATLALALADSGRSITLLEARQHIEASRDPRALALSQASRIILERLGVWQKLPAPTPILAVHISQQGGLGRASLQAEEEGMEALGYVVDYSALDLALHATLAEHPKIALHKGTCVTRLKSTSQLASLVCQDNNEEWTLTASVAAVADGGKSLEQIPGIRRDARTYNQTAVLAQVHTELPQQGVAYERFTPHGPIALLPSGDHYALVWTLPPEQAQRVLQLDEAAFLTELHNAFGDRQGRFIAASARASFPLALKTVSSVTSDRIVLLGNAAQTLHPAAGQGFNLGLRDAWALAQQLGQLHHARYDDSSALQQYSRERRLDSFGGAHFTDGLVRLFSRDNTLLHHARSLGLLALELSPGAKHWITRKLSFGAQG